MDSEQVTISEDWSRGVNVTQAMMTRWNLNVPSYLYQEVPAVFEVIGTIMNVMIIIYFIKSKRYRVPLFTILTFMAVMDTCVCVSGVMYVFLFPTVIAPEAGFMCVLSAFLSAIGLVGSEYHLLFFSVIRLYQAMAPLRARASVTMNLMVKCCATIMGLSTIGALGMTAYSRSATTVIGGKEITVCIFIGDSYSSDLVYLVFATILPCVSIFIIHVLKHWAYRKSKSFVETIKRERNSPEAHAIAIVIILFYICWIPVMTYIIIQYLTIDGYVYGGDNLYFVLLHIMIANSIVNPLVYVLAMKSIRDEVIKLFCFTRLVN